MNLSGLSFNALPPVHLPFRFFLSAPIFAFFCVTILLTYGESLWLSRWHPAMLALTHGFTLGIITMVMMGALLQILPVVAGISFPKVERIATISHVFMVIGSASLLLSFLFPHSLIILFSIISLTLAFGVFIGGLFWALAPTLKQTFNQGDTLVVIRLATIALLVVILLGLLLQLNRFGLYAGFSSLTAWLPFDKFYTNIHALLGGFGWMGLLIIAVSFQVIPMFHVAPSFPQPVRKYFAKLIAISLIALLCSSFFEFELKWFIAVLLVLQSFYVLVVINVLRKRKRKVPDITVRYWFLASVSMLFLTLLYFIDEFFSLKALQGKQDLFFSGAFIYFYLLSILQGLLIKILPFLSYTHLQQRCLMNFEAMQYLPHMHQFISKQQANVLWFLHLLAACSLLIVILQPGLYLAFSALLTIEFAYLFWIMVQTVSIYKKTSEKITQLDS